MIFTKLIVVIYRLYNFLISNLKILFKKSYKIISPYRNLFKTFPTDANEILKYVDKNIHKLVYDPLEYFNIIKHLCNVLDPEESIKNELFYSSKFIVNQKKVLHFSLTLNLIHNLKIYFLLILYYILDSLNIMSSSIFNKYVLYEFLEEDLINFSIVINLKSIDADYTFKKTLVVLVFDPLKYNNYKGKLLLNAYLSYLELEEQYEIKMIMSIEVLII
jgi:hypothetical protein